MSIEPEPVLFTAIRAADVDMIERLIARRADVNHVLGADGATPLIAAMRHYAQCCLVVRIIRKWRRDVELLGSEGEDQSEVSDVSGRLW